ncbi:hypothetical protein BDZ90DRAFT_232015 [Jaminaea rosea]|uniref:Reelin domain-containing protein n=1 Tax=Jaminaea rosea TaxID=1569628 RepID=A0A316UQK9_9BASI|nr:hypothetical protein BDZ90DRAFT_232015 [Jaminaea rosea]PWN27587.1 hypothetical protein BDZ90DRAFT_232015 [Jaminaea rosea]
MLRLSLPLAVLFYAVANGYTVTFDDSCKHDGVSTMLDDRPLPAGTTMGNAPAKVELRSPWGSFNASLALGTTSLITFFHPPTIAPFYYRGSLAVENQATTMALECNKKHLGDCDSSISIDNVTSSLAWISASPARVDLPSRSA